MLVNINKRAALWSHSKKVLVLGLSGEGFSVWCLVVLMDILLTKKKKTEGRLFLKTWFKRSHFILFKENEL